MNLKRALKPFLPPIVWSGLRRVTASHEKSPKQTKAGKDIMAMSSAQSFSIELRRITLPSGIYFIPEYAAHRPASQAVLNGTLFEPATHTVITQLLQERPGNLVHAGTFFGDMLPSFSRACPGVVFAFEPVLENYVLAKLCVQENDLDNIVLLNAGLGSTVAVTRIDTGDADGVHRGGASQISDRGQFTTLVSIDSFRISDLSIIQLDVEGYELEALRGAVETIEKNSPIVMIEDNNDKCAGFLRSLNYTPAGRIPGLSIWVSSGDKIDIQTILKRV
jgi:FkbM family methyltransferase